ncbi:uncharacterized protein LACBIDRAFT_304464 [Laccaria bicolor S238N-H82]|uniref:Predicted protein n=1 Tax=Laccaria bicolor (strain S238N-H82 / ATCC MYA-4686) TaxID=486041 RepID=B0DLN9_LACBS|nr:uncharacterized protein LACBIDRAFT_304464 [Laccaria bicolor S238N-H82]EDR04329.1 predicted protein [Laccaria bicolor S238N-H82]|eukprot:XP_001884848.1 predicted protein [Laccaria bicolor S238N-H82]
MLRISRIIALLALSAVAVASPLSAPGKSNRPIEVLSGRNATMFLRANSESSPIKNVKFL